MTGASGTVGRDNRGQSGSGHWPGMESGAGRKEEAAGAGGVSVGEGAGGRNLGGQDRPQRRKKWSSAGQGVGAQALVLVCHYPTLA